MKTYSLAEVAAKHLPAELKNPLLWLTRRLNRGELRGIRFGRYWRMSEDDVQFMLDAYHNGASGGLLRPAAPRTDSIIDGLSPRARRRVRRLPDQDVTGLGTPGLTSPVYDGLE